MKVVARKGVVFVQPESEADRLALEEAIRVEAVDPGPESRQSDARKKQRRDRSG